MKAYDIEYTIEQYKILKKLYLHKRLSGQDCEKYFGANRFERSFKILLKSNLIVHHLENDISTNDNISYYTLTTHGTNTYFILHESRFEFWKELLLSKWLDVFVAFITALITSKNSDLIINHLINLLFG